MSRLTVFFVFALSLLSAGSAGAGALSATVLGADGELFTVEQGRYGELMGRPRAPEAEHSVLVLRVHRPDRQDVLHPLPATLGPDLERAAALIYEETSNTLFVAWEVLTNIHSQIRMVGFSGGVWGEPVDVSDLRFSFKSDPRLAVTRDVFEVRSEDDEPLMVRRTVIHAVWIEERSDGLAVVYSPLILIDGAFQHDGANAIYTLTDLIEPAEENLLAVPLADLPLPPTVEAGSNDHSVVIGFVHPASGRLNTVDLAVLSGDVSTLADVARSHFIETGGRFDTGDAGELSSLADIARSHFIETGGRLDPEVLSFVADQMREFVLERGPEFDLEDDSELAHFSDLVRSHFIETGSRLENRGLRNRSAARPMILDLPDTGVASSHQIELREVSARRLDGLEAGAGAAVLLSADGTDALIAWQAAGQLRYQESRGEGWSEVRAISLSNSDLATALAIVEHRIRNR